MNRFSNILIKFVILQAILLIVWSVDAQPWLNLLPQKSKKELTFFDYQKAFNSYWKDKNVINGKYTDENGNIQKAYGWKQFKRWEYLWSTRVNPNTGNFPDKEIYDAYLSVIKDKNYQESKDPWLTMGPNSSEGGYAGIGRVNVIDFHPSDPNTFWIGAPSGGLWMTTNGGANWVPLTEELPVQGVSAIAIPSDYSTSNTIYIGTGDRDAFDNYSIGVLKSTDGGANWNNTGLTFELAHGHSVNKLLIMPNDNNALWAATTNGLYKTVNAGDSWSLETSIEYVDIEFKPNDPSIIYGATRNGKVYKNNVLIFSAINNSRIELAVTDNDPERLYILASNSSNGLEGIYRSDDAGENVSLIFDDKPLLNWSYNGTGTNDGQAWYDLALAADPIHADTLYCGGVNTWRSIDGGNTWQIINHWYGGGGVQAVHADKHYLQFRPGTSTLYECNDGGIYVSTNGTSWTDLSNTLFISQIYKLSTAQTHPDVTITGLQDNGTKMRAESIWYDVIGGDGMNCIIDPTDENIQYGSLYYGQIYRTYNMWGSSTDISQNIPGGASGAWVTPYVLDPNNPDILYVGYNTLWKSENKGNSFEAIGNFGTLHSLAVAEANSNYIAAATYSNIFLSKNGGISWTNITGYLPTATASITDICFSYNNPEIIWVTFGGYDMPGIFQSSDGGDSWETISSGIPNIPVNCIIQNKLETSNLNLFVGTDYGVYVKNGINDWIPYTSGMPLTVISDLDIYYNYADPYSCKLRAATYGRGLWESNIEMSGNFVPYVSSSGISNITETSSTATGIINNDFGNTVLQSGFVLSTNENPNISDPEVLIFYTDPTITYGEFTVDLTGLEPGTQYYCKSFAINSVGIGYGNQLNFTTQCSTISILPFIQDFDNSETIPICWSQNYLSGEDLNWTFTDPPYFNPYNGTKCAYLYDYTANEEKTLLQLPAFSLSAYPNVSLSLWHIQPASFTGQDELKILYKSNPSDNWSLIAHYTESLTSWTNRTLSLPNLSDSYFIAFEGNAKSGKGVGIDMVIIDMGNSITNYKLHNLSISPNPNNGNFFINGIDRFPIFIEVLDCSGNIIMSKLITDNQVKLNSLKKGIYFIKTIDNNSQSVTKLIII